MAILCIGGSEPQDYTTGSLSLSSSSSSFYFFNGIKTAVHFDK